MRRCPSTALGDSQCRELIHQQMAQIAAMKDTTCEVTVSTAPPLEDGEYKTAGYTCPHGVTYWVRPTDEQIAAWKRGRVR